MLHHGLLDRTNTGSAVWADAYRSRKNEAFLARNGFASHVHRKKPVGRPMPTPIRRANGRKSAVRARRFYRGVQLTSHFTTDSQDPAADPNTGFD
jgi:hypothetical protein